MVGLFSSKLLGGRIDTRDEGRCEATEVEMRLVGTSWKAVPSKAS